MTPDRLFVDGTLVLAIFLPIVGALAGVGTVARTPDGDPSPGSAGSPARSEAFGGALASRALVASLPVLFAVAVAAGTTLDVGRPTTRTVALLLVIGCCYAVAFAWLGLAASNLFSDGRRAAAVVIVGFVSLTVAGPLVGDVVGQHLPVAGTVLRHAGPVDAYLTVLASAGLPIDYGASALASTAAAVFGFGWLLAGPAVGYWPFLRNGE